MTDIQGWLTAGSVTCLAVLGVLRFLGYRH